MRAKESASLHEGILLGKPSLASVQEIITTNLPQNPEKATRGQMRDVVKTVGESQYLASVIASVLEDPALLEKAAYLAQFHALGFTKITLPLTEDPFVNPYRLQLNIYDNPAGKSEDPHRHTFNYASKIVFGAMRKLLYEPHDDGKLMEEYESSPGIGINNATLILRGGRRISPKTSITVIPEGAVYTFSKDTLHQVQSPLQGKVPHTTLFLRTRDLNPSSTFFRSGEIEKTGTIQGISSALVSEKLDRLQHYLRRQS